MIYGQKVGTMEAGRSPIRKKIFHEYLIEVLRDTSLQGLVHFTYSNRHPIEYLAWAMTIIAAMGGAISVCLKTWNRYQISPTVIAMEFNYLDWGIDQPSTYICPTSVVEENLLYTEAQKILGRETSKENVMYVARFLETAVNATYNNFWKLQEFANDTTLLQSGYLDLAIKMKYNLTYHSARPLDCTLTEMGFCYAFNSRVANITSPEYMGECSPSAKKKPGQPIHANYAGLLKIRETGIIWLCTSPRHAVIISLPETSYPEIRARSKSPNPVLKLMFLEKGIFTMISSINSAFTAYVQSPSSIPNIAMPSGYSHPLGQTEVLTTVLETYATSALRSLSVNQRKCRFNDESNLKHSSVYSINHCKQECRMEFSLRLCGCLPFFYNISTERTCNVTGMLCLAEHNETLLFLKNFTTQEKLHCPCLPSCDQIEYTIVDSSDVVLGSMVGPALLKTKIDPPQMRIRRDVLFSNIDLMVSFGGAVGLFLGSSVLSFVEIPYYCTLRLFFYLLRKRYQE